MNGHPGGDAHTMRMIELCALSPGARVLDMGAGTGAAVALLRTQGHKALGIDIKPCGGGVERGNMLRTGFANGSFDAVFSQCAFYVSGNQRAALRESFRLLRSGGVLAVSDVFFEPPEQLVRGVGFKTVHIEDMTDEWREYYFSALWSGAADCCSSIKGKCGYYMLVCRKEVPDGST